jgi:hypothetical protein
MSLDEYNDLLDRISPKYYRQFRLLYNEMIGYMEREEYDKLSEFSSKVQTQLSQSLQLQKALQHRLNAVTRQQKGYQKQKLQQLFKKPLETIAYDVKFPLKKPKNKPDQSLQANSPDPVADSTLENDRKIHQLMSDMERFDRHKKAGKLLEGMTYVAPDISEDVNKAPDGGAALEQISNNQIADTLDLKGESLDDEFVDDRLKMRQKKEDDIKRSKYAGQPLPSQKQFDTKRDESISDQSSDRTDRVWDYIDKDQQKGDISDSR